MQHLFNTIQETARLIVQETGANYLFTAKSNQPTLCKTVCGLLKARAFSPSGSTKIAEWRETNRGRKERRQLRLQDTTREQGCFVAAAQIGELQSWTVRKGKASAKIWPVITSAHPKIWQAKELLQCRCDYWGIEGVFHQRLDATLDEDRSRVRTLRGLTVPNTAAE